MPAQSINQRFPSNPMNLLQLVQSQLHHSQYLIAFSGGLDSTALLALMAKIRENQPHLQLRAVHIHHGLNPNADSWVQHCQQICQQFAIPLLVKKVQIDRKNGIEQGARLARYQAIAEIKLPEEIVVTAHHLQDQTETFLLTLKRGSGIKGLGAMQPQSTVFNLPIFRPLLNVSRAELEQFVQQQRLTWVEDDSNVDQHFDRNFLRRSILPILRQRWADFDQAVQRSAQHCYQQQQLINELLEEDFAQSYDKIHRSFNLAPFSTFSPNKQNALLRLWLETLNQPMPSQIQLEQIKHNVIGAKADAIPQFHLGDKVIRRYQNQLYLTPIFNDVMDFQANLTLNQNLELPDQLGTISLQPQNQQLEVIWQKQDYQRTSQLPVTDEPISIRFGYSGKVRLKNEKFQRDIKKVWQTFNIPPWQRQRIPLVFFGEKLQAAVGFFVTD